MNNNFLLFLCIGALFCGCASVQSPSANDSNSGLKILSSGDKVIILSDTMDSLQLVMEPQGNEPAFSKLLCECVGNGIVKSKSARLSLNGAADVRLILIPQFQQRDVVGNYYRTDCQVAVRLCLGNGERILASDHFLSASVKRVLGVEESKNRHAVVVGKKIADWSAGVLEEIRQKQLNVSVLRFSLCDPNLSIDKSENARRVNRIGSMIHQMDGVVSCQLYEQDFIRGTCAYRIVYFTEKFPMGLENAISAQL